MPTPRYPTAEEKQLAQVRKAELEAALEKKRLIGLVGFAILIAIAVVVAIFGPELVAFSIAGVSLIVLLQSMSAHSHLQVVREQKALYLFPDFSVLRQTQSSDASMQSPKQ